MKVSIIIPVYNVSKYIERCLKSVLGQTWKDLEIILVDDCTPDDSMDIVRGILETSSRSDIVTILKHEKNRGLSAARNTGIRQATGNYLYFLDSDDYLPANGIELLADAAIQYDVDFVIGNYEITGSPRWTPPLLLDTCLLVNNKEILSAYSKDKWYVMAWNKLIRKSFVNDSSLFFRKGLYMRMTYGLLCWLVKLRRLVVWIRRLIIIRFNQIPLWVNRQCMLWNAG